MSDSYMCSIISGGGKFICMIIYVKSYACSHMCDHMIVIIYQQSYTCGSYTCANICASYE